MKAGRSIHLWDKHEDLEGGLTMGPCSKAMVSPVGPLISQATDSRPDLQKQANLLSFAEGLSSSQREVGHPHSSHANIVPVTISCLALHYCSSQDL